QGIVDAVDHGSIVVSGRTILVTERTKIVGLSESTASLDRLLGLLVTVVATEEPAGWVALIIQPHPRFDPDGTVIVTGEITVVRYGIIAPDTTEMLIVLESVIVTLLLYYRVTLLLPRMTVEVKAVETATGACLAKRIFVHDYA